MNSNKLFDKLHKVSPPAQEDYLVRRCAKRAKKTLTTTEAIHGIATWRLHRCHKHKPSNNLTSCKQHFSSRQYCFVECHHVVVLLTHLAVILGLLLAGSSDLGEVGDDLLCVLSLASARLTAAREEASQQLLVGGKCCYTEHCVLSEPVRCFMVS